MAAVVLPDRLAPWRAWLVALAVVLLSGCAAQQTNALRAARPDDLPPKAEMAQAPFFPQTDYQCGPAALATALAFEGMAVSPELLAREIFLPAREGTLQTEMITGARRHGAVATLIPPRLDDLLREIAQGHVVVVFQNLGLTFAPRWHYAVAVGYDLDASEVLLRSGTTRREAMNLRTFEHTWVRSGSWAFVALAPGRWPATAQLQAVIEAAVGFERVATPADALRAYESALLRWPDELTLEIGAGNAAYSAGDQPRAAEIFEAAAKRHDSPAAWVNLATVHIEAGRNENAAAAARHATEDPRWGERARQILAAALAVRR